MGDRLGTPGAVGFFFNKDNTLKNKDKFGSLKIFSLNIWVGNLFIRHNRVNP